MQTNQTSKWIVDAVLFFGFIAAFLFDLTGLALHQWLGVAVAALAVYHLITHWSWVSTVTRRFFGQTGHRARLYYLLDAAILAGFVAITLTGLAVSTWLDLTLSNAPAWMEAHTLVSILTLVLVVLKVGLHWRWVVTVAKKSVRRPAAQPTAPAVAVTAVQRTSRREFLELMGVVGVSSVIALRQAAEGLEVDAGGPAGPGVSGNLPASNLSCTVQCGRRCSFPGECNRYIDTNGNKRCDHGECASSTPDSTQAGAEVQAQTDSSAAASSNSSNQSCLVPCEHRCSYPGQCHRYTDSNGNNCCDYGECTSASLAQGATSSEAALPWQAGKGHGRGHARNGGASGFGRP